MDLHEQHQHDVARQFAEVKQRARPWRAIIALVLAAAAGIIASLANHGFEYWTGNGHATSKLVTLAAGVAFCLFGIVGILALAGRTRQALQPVAGSAHAAVVRYSIVLAGAVFTLVVALALFKVPVGQLVLGGAFTTILIGIAAQQSLSNVFAGLVLLLSRPFNVGDAVQLRSGAMGGLLEGTVTEIGISYLRLDTADGPMSLPNSQVLAAAVSHRTQPASTTPPAGQSQFQAQSQSQPSSASAQPAPAPAPASGAAPDGRSTLPPPQ